MEPRALEAVLEVERRPAEERRAGGVDDDLDPTEVGDRIVGGDVAVEEHLVAVARAAARPHCDAERQRRVAFGLEELPHLRRGGVGEVEDRPAVGDAEHARHATRLPEAQLNLTGVAVREGAEPLDTALAPL